MVTPHERHGACTPCTQAQRLERTCSSKLQQRTRDLAFLDAPIRGWLGTNDAQRGPLHHFASKGLGVRVPLAPPLVRVSLPLLRGCTFLPVQQKVQQSRPPVNCAVPVHA
jgi:hypothetical protein